MNRTQCPSCGTPVSATTRYCSSCGFRIAGTVASLPYAVVPATSNASPMVPGKLIGGRYRLEARIASGAMGDVWRGRDERLHNRPCAVKSVLLGGATRAEQDERAAWFVREAEMLSTLHHPSICDIRDVVNESGMQYLILELIEGHTLADELVIRGAPGLPVADVLAWAAELCEALTYLHTRTPAIIFRDLKPQNVMIRPNGHIAIIDFGIARATTRSGGTAIGTGGYAPPEQYQGLAEPRSDVYALAALLHHLLTGRDPTINLPFTFPAVRAIIPTLSPHVEKAIQSALSMRIEERPSSALAFMDALRGAYSGTRVALASTPPLSVVPATNLLPSSQSSGIAIQSHTESEQILAVVIHDGHEFVLTTRAAYIASSPVIEVARTEARSGFIVRRHRHWGQVRIGGTNGRVIAACSDVSEAQVMVFILEQWMLSQNLEAAYIGLRTRSPNTSIRVIKPGTQIVEIHHGNLRRRIESACEEVKVTTQNVAILSSIHHYGLRKHVQSVWSAGNIEQFLNVARLGKYEIVFTTRAAYIANTIGSTVTEITRVDARSGIALRIHRGVAQVRLGGARGDIVAVFDQVSDARDIIDILERWAMG